MDVNVNESDNVVVEESEVIIDNQRRTMRRITSTKTTVTEEVIAMDDDDEEVSKITEKSEGRSEVDFQSANHTIIEDPEPVHVSGHGPTPVVHTETYEYYEHAPVPLNNETVAECDVTTESYADYDNICLRVPDPVIEHDPKPSAEQVEVAIKPVHHHDDVGVNKSIASNLMCFCKSPSGKQIYGLINDNDDGTYTIDINASEPGLHVVDVLEDGKKIPGSPFLIRIIQAVDQKKVQIYGDGLKSGVISHRQDLFHIDTNGAGPGELKVRVHGPKESFDVEMARNVEDNRKVDVRYYPTAPGIYTIKVFWSGEHVAGSPVEILLAENENQLEKWITYPEIIRKNMVMLTEVC